MKLKALAEAMILQSLEDLWDERFRPESLSFFSNPDFSIVARLADMNTEDQLKLMYMVNGINGNFKKARRDKKVISAGRAYSSPQALSAPPRT